MKSSILAPLLLIVSITLLHAQNELETRYYDKYGRATSAATSEYYDVGKPSVSGVSLTDTVKSYYSDTKTLREKGYYSAKGLRQGEHFSYYRNGVIEEHSRWKDNLMDGVVEGNYKNGKPQFRYEIDSAVINGYQDDMHRILDYWDSLGSQLVKDGNGRCVCDVELASGKVRQEGIVKNSKRDGEWRGFKNDTLYYVETYEDGALKTGKSFRDGKEFNYTASITKPLYPGDLPALYREVSTIIRYPSDSRRAGIEGTVFVGFVVNRQGVLEDIKVLRGVSKDIDNESRRVVKLLNGWDPATFKGQPIRAKFILPLKFKLSE